MTDAGELGDGALGVDALGVGAVVAGRYRIEGRLGEGGMGVVYAATHVSLGRPVALKVLRPELVRSEAARARFEREAIAATALDHPAAVAIHDFGEDDGRLFLVMERVEGEGLRAILEAGALTAARALELAWQLADVIRAAHAVGLVHRDLKPENAIVERGDDGAERVRVLDFGLAFLAEGPAGRMTREGVVVGTPEYLSPEQARGGEVGPPTDVYALGCVLHELVAGHPPFVGTEMEVLTKQLYAPPPAWHPTRAPIPAALDALRRAMLDKDPARRPRAEEVASRLRALDPDPMRARARAGTDGYLGPRAARMVDAAPSPASPAAGELELAIVGEASGALVLGLRANGIHAFTTTREALAEEPPPAAIYAPGADADAVRALAALGAPVVVDAPRGDVKGLSAFLRAGAADVVLRPVTAAALAQKIGRVTR